jgi:hypothetical protein
VQLKRLRINKADDTIICEMQLGCENSFSGSVRSVQYVPIEERVIAYERCFVIGERS